jgi:hypothetical protein
MSDFEPETLETELAGLKAARLPEEFAADLSRKLAGVRPGARPRQPIPARTSFLSAWLRWAIPAAAVLVVTISLVGRHRESSIHSKPTQNSVLAEKTVSSAPPVSVLKPDAILISQELVGNFDALTRLPDGAPVRVQCQEWVDEVQLRDPARGVWVERRKPRVEIVRVGYEIY